MSSDGHSITTWIERLRQKDSRAAAALWERFCQRMLAFARQRLGAVPRGVADEEDVVVVAFERFLHGVRRGRFPRLAGRDDLWAVLATLTARHAARQIRDLHREVRGGGVAHAPVDEAGFADGSLSPDEAAAFQDEFARLMGALEDDELRQIALARLEGYSNAEIAGQIGRSEVTVERRLRRVRATWEALGGGNLEKP